MYEGPGWPFGDFETESRWKPIANEVGRFATVDVVDQQ
jgi:hypothetical protein